MRRIAIAVIGLALLATTWLALRPGVAQEAPAETLYITGLQIGPRTKAIVRLRNIDPASEGSTVFDYRVLDPAAGQVVIPIQVGQGARILPGRMLELDLSTIVRNWRIANEIGRYAGPVTFQAQAAPDLLVEFGSANIAVEAVQTVRGARYGGAVEWTRN